MDRIGTTIGGKYRIERFLARGGNATVYAAVHEVTRRQVAIKVIARKEVESSPKIAQRFLREASAFSTIRHAGVVEVIDAGTAEDGSLYLVQELLSGVTLLDALVKTGLDAEAIVRIGVEVAEALSAVHESGLVHRDVKPGNVFLVGGTRPKLLDFGLARPVNDTGSLTGAGRIIGTPMYMSPEQARGEAEIQPPSDVFSLGSTLFHALGGRPPFRSRNVLKLIMKVSAGNAPSLGESRPDLPDDLVSTIDRALRSSPELRWPSASDFGRELDRVLVAARIARARWLDSRTVVSEFYLEDSSAGFGSHALTSDTPISLSQLIDDSIPSISSNELIDLSRSPSGGRSRRREADSSETATAPLEMRFDPSSEPESVDPGQLSGPGYEWEDTSEPTGRLELDRPESTDPRLVAPVEAPHATDKVPVLVRPPESSRGLKLEHAHLSIAEAPIEADTEVRDGGPPTQDPVPITSEEFTPRSNLSPYSSAPLPTIRVGSEVDGHTAPPSAALLARREMEMAEAFSRMTSGAPQKPVAGRVSINPGSRTPRARKSIRARRWYLALLLVGMALFALGFAKLRGGSATPDTGQPRTR
ncbi:MAG: serine/threonine protein kinase [Deltaproteobacteria bacterium]|nr:serine/threonine protein kinase [Deltaproteobacteria bacterium]